MALQGRFLRRNNFVLFNFSSYFKSTVMYLSRVTKSLLANFANNGWDENSILAEIVLANSKSIKLTADPVSITASTEVPLKEQTILSSSGSQGLHNKTKLSL